MSLKPKSTIQNPKWLRLSIVAFVFVVAGAVAEAQQPGKIHRIGYVSGGSFSPHEAFVQGLGNLGYFEGKNITVEHRVGGRSEVYPDIFGRSNSVEGSSYCCGDVARSYRCQESNPHDPDRHDNQHRSGRDRAHCQLCAARR
jgi:hypothetical protein